MIGQIPLHPKEDALSILVLLVTVRRTQHEMS